MSKTTLAIVAGVSAAAGAAAATIFSASRSERKTALATPIAPLNPVPAAPSPLKEIIPPINPAGLFQYGFPGPINDLHPTLATTSAYDRRNRNPLWVAEHITPASLSAHNADRRHSVFVEDETIPSKFRAKLLDYFRSGYDRGHQVPAADAKWSQTALNETFLLSNMCPQVGDGFNRDYWAHFEDFCRRLTNDYPSVRIVTGPLYLPRKDSIDGKWRVSYEVIGNPPNVSVPTHFYKVIFAEDGRTGGNVSLGAFVLPNAKIANDKPLTDFEVPVEAIERASGLEFAAKLPMQRRKKLCEEIHCSILPGPRLEESPTSFSFCDDIVDRGIGAAETKRLGRLSHKRQMKIRNNVPCLISCSLRIEYMNSVRPSSASNMEFLTLHPFVRQTVIDKARGVIVGSALGDCIGLYTEFLSQQMSEEAYPERRFSLVEPVTAFKSDSHRDKFELHAWTDDTDHAILIILSYLRNNGKLLTGDFAARLRSWCEQGLRCLNRVPLGLGRTVGSIVLNPEYLKAPEETAHKYWVKTDRHVAPNGSLMRTHPLGIICLPLSREQTYQIATKYSQLTHVDPRCVLSCCILTVLISELLRGRITTEPEVDEAIENAFEWVSQKYRPDAESQDPLLDRKDFERHAYVKDFADLQLDDSQKMGYVYKSLGAAILCLRLVMRPRDLMDAFESIITDLVMQGGDADTNACCAAALLGAWLGYSKLPNHWRSGLMHRSWLLEKTDDLCCVVGISTGDYDGGNDRATWTDDELGRLLKDELEEREKQIMTKVLLKQKERYEKNVTRKHGIRRIFGGSNRQ